MNSSATLLLLPASFLAACGGSPEPSKPTSKDTCSAIAEPSVVFPRPGVPYPVENPHSTEKMLLGKILFWEEQLSSDDTVACGTCHQPRAGGADVRSLITRHPGEDGTLGTADDPHGSAGIRRCQTNAEGDVAYVSSPIFGDEPQVTSRRAPSFLDAMHTNTLFWDGRASDTFIDPDTLQAAIASGGALESQAVGPPVNPNEMACESRTWPMVHAKLVSAAPLALARNLPADMSAAICNYPSYPELFAWAFGTPEINTKRIAFAIATYERTLQSDETPYHRYVAGDTTALTIAQQEGMAQVIENNSKANCQRCHKPQQQLAGNRLSNLGFTDSLWDPGATGIGDFRAPSLMNVALREGGTNSRRGLLHDGVAHADSLENIMAAYNVPPRTGGNVDTFMTPLNLSETEIADIIDFMRAGLTDPRVAEESYPFDRPFLSTE